METRNVNKPAYSKEETNKPKEETKMATTTVPSHLTKMVSEEDYLMSKGWEKCGINSRGILLWTDPRSKAKEEMNPGPTLKLPGGEGRTFIVNQLHVPSCSWQMNTFEAAEVQRDRDREVA